MTAFATVEQFKTYLLLLLPGSGEGHLAESRLLQKLEAKASSIRGRARHAGYGTLAAPTTVTKQITVDTNPTAGQVLNAGNTVFVFTVGTPAVGQIQIGVSAAATAGNVATALTGSTSKSLCVAGAVGDVVDAVANDPATDFLLTTDAPGLTIETISALTQRDLLLRTLNLEEAAAEELATIGAHWDPELQKLAEKFRVKARWVRDMFDGGFFDESFSDDLPVDPLATPDDVRGEVPGFKAEVTGTPTLHQANELCAGYSAVVYSLAAIQGYAVSGLTTDQVNVYREIVKCLVGAVIERAYGGTKIEGFGAVSGALDPQANSLATRALEGIKSLAGNYYDEVLA